MFILAKLAAANVLPVHLYGREKITPQKAFLITLWYLGNQESFRQISERFNVTRSSSFRIVRKVINWLVAESPKYIKWPRNEEAVENINTFKKKHKIHGILGCIDGCHIKILRPKVDSYVSIYSVKYLIN